MSGAPLSIPGWVRGGDAEPGCRHQACRSHAAAAATCTTCTLQGKQKIFGERRKYLHIKRLLNRFPRQTDTGASRSDVVWGWMMVFTYNEVIKYLSRLKHFIQDHRIGHEGVSSWVTQGVHCPLLWTVSEAEVIQARNEAQEILLRWTAGTVRTENCVKLHSGLMQCDNGMQIWDVLTILHHLMLTQFHTKSNSD